MLAALPLCILHQRNGRRLHDAQPSLVLRVPLDDPCSLVGAALTWAGMRGNAMIFCMNGLLGVAVQALVLTVRFLTRTSSRPGRT